MPKPHVAVTQDADEITDHLQEFLIGFAVLRPLLEPFLCAGPIAANAFQREERVVLIDLPDERFHVGFVD